MQYYYHRGRPFAGVFALVLILLTLLPTVAVACKNLDLNVGVIDSREGRLFAQMMATFIHERTAVKTGMYYFASREEMEAALEEKKVQIIVVDVADALAGLGETPSGDPAADFDRVRSRYRETTGYVWLDPFGFSGEAGQRAPVIRQQILEKFPALPRVLAKLTRSVSDEARSELLAAVGDDGDVNEVSERFLLRKRLI